MRERTCKQVEHETEVVAFKKTVCLVYRYLWIISGQEVGLRGLQMLSNTPAHGSPQQIGPG